MEDNAAHSSLKTLTQTTGGKQLQAAAEQVKEALASRTHNLFTQNSFSALIILTLLCSCSWLEETRAGVISIDSHSLLNQEGTFYT